MLLLCDLDDTLIDRAATFQRWAEDFCESRQLPAGAVMWMSEQDRRGYTPREALWQAIRTKYSLQEDVPILVEEFCTSFFSRFRCTEATIAALKRARHAGFKIAIVTNGSPSQMVKIEAASLEPHVDAICVSGIEGFAKPEAAIYELAASRCGSTLSDGWMVGDNPDTDLLGAHRLGLRTTWVSQNLDWPRTDFTPTHRVATFPEAVNRILGHA